MRLNQETDIPSNFNGTNYQDWADEMTFYLQGKGYWEVVICDPPGMKAGETETLESFIVRSDQWKSKDWQAKGLICQSIDREYVGQIKDELTAKNMWEKMNLLFSARTIESEFAETVRFHSIELDEGGDVIEFLSEIERLHWKLNVRDGDRQKKCSSFVS